MKALWKSGLSPLRHLVWLGATALSAGLTTPAHSQSIFCPSSIPGQSGVHFSGVECTNGNTGAYSNAALAAQTLTDLSQSSTQDSSKAAMEGIQRRRATEEGGCPEGLVRIGGVCRRPSRPTPFAAESQGLFGAGAQLPPEFHSAYAADMPVKAPPLAAPRNTPVGSWIQAYGDYERRTGRAQGTGEFSVLTLDAKSKSGSGGVVGGFDVTLRGVLRPDDGVIVGVLGGYSVANLKVKTTSTSSALATVPSGFNTLDADLAGPQIGAYASYFSGGFSTDVAVKAEFLAFDIATSELLGFNANPALGIAPTTVPFAVSGSTGLVAYTANANVNYRFALGAGTWLMPTVGVQYTRSEYDSDAARFGLADGYLVRLQGGARFGLDRMWNQTPVSVVLSGLLYSNVRIEGGLIAAAGPDANPLILNDEGKLRGLGSVALNVQHGNGLSSFVQGEVRGGEDLFGVGGRAGARLVW